MRGLMVLAVLLCGCTAAAPPVTTLSSARVTGRQGMVARLVVEGRAPVGASCQMMWVQPIENRGADLKVESVRNRAWADPVVVDERGAIRHERDLSLGAWPRGQVTHVTLRCDPGGVSETVPVNPWV